MKQIKVEQSHRKNHKSNYRHQERDKNKKNSKRKEQNRRHKQHRRRSFSRSSSGSSQNSQQLHIKPKFEQQLMKEKIEQKQEIIKEVPCFEPSGILLEFYNSRQGVKLKFHQPPESKQPIDDWRIYPFKGQSNLNPILLKNSCYLIGKDERICDILCQNPSISRQHAVIQFRQIHKQNVDGTYDQLILPYIMDLESTNGTFLNQEQIEAGRYIQILDRDVMKFGLSDRIYIFVKVPAENQQS